MSNFKLNLIIWAIGKCQTLMLWLQERRFKLIESQLDEIEKL